MDRKTGIEPAYKAWKALILPLNYFRKIGELDRNRTYIPGLKVQCSTVERRAHFCIQKILFRAYIILVNLFYLTIYLHLE